MWIKTAYGLTINANCIENFNVKYGDKTRAGGVYAVFATTKQGYQEFVLAVYGDKDRDKAVDLIDTILARMDEANAGECKNYVFEVPKDGQAKQTDVYTERGGTFWRMKSDCQDVTFS